MAHPKRVENEVAQTDIGVTIRVLAPLARPLSYLIPVQGRDRGTFSANSRPLIWSQFTQRIQHIQHTTKCFNHLGPYPPN
jgi:hypothetical protein